ncbi:fasciclin-like arabinogalactan protein 21 [Chenopodium quinoa]|uniref:fasciclin-like arabinogalactan protein 21 n=1 Tax=Chenopodium quinoa TaxID=63459 RepID=UPI000B77E01E|nr:fasciclin-like arabinogalactan protein 21 [Chenopodium quinoa]
MASLPHHAIIFMVIFTSLSVLPPAINAQSSTFIFSSSSTSPPPSSTASTPPPFPYSSSEALRSPEFLSPLYSITKILAELGFTDLAMASHSLSLSSASHSPWLGPVTVFAPADASVRTCTSCSLTLLLQEHTVPGLYPLDYLNQLIFGTKIESILPGRCLTVTSAANSTKIFIGGAEITHPNLFISDHVIIHGLQGFISHFSPYSCSMDRMTSLSLRHLSPSVALTRMMLVDAGIRLRLSGYSFLALAMRVKYAELVTLQNMTIFAVDDSTIFQGGHSYVHGVRFHIIPNQMLKLADLESLPPSTVLPTFESGETLTITTPGGGGSSSPLRINYVKIKYPDLIYNYKLVVHGIGSPFPHLRQSIPVSTGRSGFYPITAGEYGSDVRESSFGNVRPTSSQSTAPSPAVIMNNPVVVNQMDEIYQGL